MCETCEKLESMKKKARAEGNAEKERVMTVLLNNHHRINHPNRHNVVAIEPSAIIWPDGTRWIVRAYGSD